MDIIKTFENNNAGMHITIQGTPEEPLFRASDIAAIFEIAQINSTIRDFDSSEKVVHSMHTPGGQQEVTFLTEKGLYEIMFRSRKPIAKQFKNWVCEVIKEIRLNCKYELEKQIKDVSDKQSSNLLTNYSKKPLVYIGYTEPGIIKFGYTDDLETRIKDHKKEIKSDFTFEYIYESLYNREIERQIKQHSDIKKLSKKYNGKNQTELIQLSKTFTIKELDKIIKEIKQQIESGDLIETLRLENAELKLENTELKKLKSEAHLKTIDLQTNSMYNLYDKISNIRKTMIYNFLVEFIAKAIINNVSHKDFEVKLELNEILGLYRTYIQKFKFTDIMYNEDSEKGLITKVLNEVSGIKHGFIGKINARIFYVAKVSEWLCENVNITPEYVGVIKKMAKNSVNQEYCKILNPEIKDNELLTSSYSFLIHLVLKFKNTCGNKYDNIIVISNMIVKEEYTKFMLQFDSKVRKITYMIKILEEIGIESKNIRNGGNSRLKVICINFNNVLNWIKDNLEIPEEFSQLLING